MPATPEELINIEARNQVLLERLKQGMHEDFAPYLKRIDRAVRNRLLEEGEVFVNKAASNKAISDIDRLQAEIYNEYLELLAEQLEDVSDDQESFEVDALNQVLINVEAEPASDGRAWQASRVNPLSVVGIAGGGLLEPFIKDWSDSSKEAVSTAIRQGYTQGQTINEIVRNIRGTKALSFKDGRLDKVNRDNRTIVRTGVQHVSSQAKNEVYKKNRNIVVGVGVDVTLDRRTSDICRGLSDLNPVWPVDEGPRAPYHRNCRTQNVAVLDDRYSFLREGATKASKGADGGKQVSADLTYYSWLKKQPAKFQDDAIGPTRGKLLRNGGLTSKEFADLSLDKNFQPLTLAEMQSMRPDVFKNANIEL